MAWSFSKTAKRIYFYMVKTSKPVSIRDIARALNLPVSTVHYHVKKLIEQGLIVEDSDGYRVKEIRSIEGFVLIGRKLFPRFIIYSMLFLGFTIGQGFVTYLYGLNMERILALVISIVAFIVFLIEGLLMSMRIYE